MPTMSCWIAGNRVPCRMCGRFVVYICYTVKCLIFTFSNAVYVFYLHELAGMTVAKN